MRALCLLAAVAVTPAAPAVAQSSAAAPLRIIVPLPAGATSDVVARVLADGLREDLGRLTPEVPTFREQGYAALELTGWIGVFATAKTPAAAIDRLAGAVAAVLSAPAARERLTAMGLAPAESTPDALAARIAADTARWRAIVEASGVTRE